MILPAIIYLLLNGGKEGASGWGIPMATDIAFVVGIMSLLGPKFPFTLKIFILALAIVRRYWCYSRYRNPLHF